jgi:large subunit ribosomal protein L23
MKEPQQIIRRPLITEKSTQQKEESRQYVFEVDPKANKIEIKAAVEQLFKVKVTKVRTLNVLGKIKRLGRRYGKRPDWKKAIVTLKEGDRIDFFEGA